MKAKTLLTLFIFLIILFNPDKIYAIYEPLSVSNNKYGIHIIDENDLEEAANLVNSSGGDWGYITVVISESDRNLTKWQGIFDKMRLLHLIPIVRLATTSDGAIWNKPNISDATLWTNFLSQLPWVSKNRYVIIFNEPNHAKEWGGKVNPQEYAQVLDSFSTTLKAKSDDYFILPAGLDASAPNSKITTNEIDFLSLMKKGIPDIFLKIDGWTSHSYPNPGFVGQVKDNGKGSLRTYLWELDYLKKLGVEKSLPVFITETGWPHQEGISNNYSYFKAEKVAQLITEASFSVWNERDKIVAITPFIFNYQSYPFDHFSWKVPLTSNYFPQYEAYRQIQKSAGNPILTEVALPEAEVLGLEKESTEQKTNPSLLNRMIDYFTKLQSKFSSILNIR
ncbi:hypothetical protein A2960_01965 [Candidatus Gottesmanbacteria bacterium RIFCSPLOWO2_01_FULL_39_12b]|uniref:Asl1-like glycosyl hydrolase catalytic domain-containing protein n=1 Tax=Candidatus Gottesmanbacteria bacterium RIFCSPLOWO2_01_FULL_39_12b TaxID=1798388 RepID=A0A1F6AQD3_9BACT|nr:MAG: hypothetical protein A2960_01965 [Candidatus Gottesmanbacteria bacterium RIFCSPLOWO2_01_FULL_39_12b]